MRGRHKRAPDPGVRHSGTNGSLRLWLTFDGLDVQLTKVTALAMRASPSIPIGAGEALESHSGAWVEVRDQAGRCLWRRILHDPFRTVIEAPVEGGGFTNAYRANPSGTLILLVPDLPDGRSVTIVSSPLEPGRRHQPARDVAEFDLGER